MFISYAQNFEDVRLWRALKEVNQGFYIDIGAQDPSADSVSKGFYEQGWRGVHVEPVARYARALRESRPDEDVIEAAVSLHEGGIPFFEIADTGLSTGRQLVAERHRESGFAVKELKVASIRLAALLSA
ncbi:MAG: FkbM family methyltransferase, partial [Xanthobacteraceae bacterium]|nr:FkbM family methyltransferase [Xanthobacteraceae bacterium]